MKCNKSLIFHLIGIGIVLFFFIFLVSVNIIGFSVKDKCHIAQGKYGGDCVEALINYLEDENNTYGSRNGAIWALGQLGDERAMPVLEKYYAEGSESDTKWNEGLSKFELEVAMSYMKGNPNITTFFWRFGKGIDKI